MSTQARDVRPGRAPQGASPDVIESTLSANREAIDHTLTEIQERLSAEGLMNTAMERLRSESGVEFLRGLRDTVVHNPLPITVIALGMVWAATAERGGSSGSRRIGSSSPGGAEHEDIERRMHGSASGSSGGSGRLQGARERTRAMMSRSRETSGGWSQTAITRSRESASRSWQFTREHPVLMAGAGIALGAGLAALLPTTRMERERVGPVRDETVRGSSRFAAEAGRGAFAGATGRETPTTEGPAGAEGQSDAGGASERWGQGGPGASQSKTEGQSEADPRMDPEGTDGRPDTTEEPANRPI